MRGLSFVYFAFYVYFVTRDHSFTFLSTAHLIYSSTPSLTFPRYSTSSTPLRLPHTVSIHIVPHYHFVYLVYICCYILFTHTFSPLSLSSSFVYLFAISTLPFVTFCIYLCSLHSTSFVVPAHLASSFIVFGDPHLIILPHSHSPHTFTYYYYYLHHSHPTFTFCCCYLHTLLFIYIILLMVDSFRLICHSFPHSFTHFLFSFVDYTVVNFESCCSHCIFVPFVGEQCSLR